MEYGLALLWLAVLHGIAIAGWPIAARLFPRWGDRGAAFALPVSLALVTIVTYWIGQVRFGWTAIVPGLVALVVGSEVARRGLDEGLGLRDYRETAIVFTLGFVFLLAIRAVDPAVTPLGGEKFLDFGLLQSLLRAEALPPEDVWFAGAPVQYYYGGHLIASILATLTGTGAAYAYNLSLAGFYAMLVTAAYGLAAAIAERKGLPRWRAGAFGVFFVGFASNLSTPARFLYWLLPDALASPLVGSLGVEPERLANGPSEFHYWSASRVIEGTINEFPLFAFLNGDLHAHMMSMPFLLLVAALLFEYVRTPAEERWRRRLLVFGVVPVVGGLLAVINTWDFPSVAGLALLALALAPAPPTSLLPARVTPDRDGWTGWHGEAERIAVAVGLSVGVGMFGVLWVAPFFTGTASGREIGFLPGRSSFGGLVLVHGAFLAIFVAYLYRRLPAGSRDQPVHLAAVGAIALVLTWVQDVVVVALVGIPLVVGWLLLRRTVERSETGVGYETLLLIAGAGLVLLVEFVYVQEQAGPERLNTVFKTYTQVWLLWGTAAAVMLAALLDRPAPDSTVDRDRRTADGGRETGVGETPADAGAGTTSERDPLSGVAFGQARQVATFLAICLVVSLSLYGALALSNHFAGDHDPTLDATAFVDVHHPEEAEAIAWLDDREGQPTMVSAPGVRSEMYGWVNAPSSLTGVPTVAGWAHEVGYRGEEAYDQRVEDVDLIYLGDTGERIELLAAYDVRYVYLGPTERERYGDREFGFERVPGVSIAHQSGDVIIYEVDQETLREEGGVEA